MSIDTVREKRFDWPLCYDAENYILARLEAFTERNSFSRRLAERMLKETGTLLLDWVDYLVVPHAEEKRLREVGFTEDPFAETPAHLKSLWHPETMLPRVLVERDESAVRAPDILAIRCESIADFLAAHNLSAEPEGAPLSRFRRALVSEEDQTRLKVVERRGYRGFVPARPAGEVEGLLKVSELWRLRPRHFANDAEGFRQIGHRGEIGDWNRKLICPREFQNAVPGILPIVTGSFGIGRRYDQSIPEARHLLHLLVGPIDPLKKLLVQVFAFLAGKLCGSRGGDIFLEFPKFLRPIVHAFRLQGVFEPLIKRHRIIKLHQLLFEHSALF